MRERMLKWPLLFFPLLFKISLQANFLAPLAIVQRERVRLTSPTSPQTLKNRGKEDLDASKEKRFHYKNCYYSTSLSYRQNIKSFAILSSTRFGILSLINYGFKFHSQKPMQINYAVSSCRWACFLNRILLFWNQTFTCVSVNLSEAASRRLSSPATYCCLENVLSNCSNCTGVKMVRDLLFGLSFSFLPASFLSRSKFRTKMCKSQITSH